MITYLQEIATTLLKNQEDKMVLKELSTIVAPLTEVDADYPKRVLNYILTADDPQILQELQNCTDDKAGVLIDFPGTAKNYYWGSYNNTKKEERFANQSRNARFRLYQRIFKALHDEQIIRYSKFLCAVTKLENYSVLSPLSPKWFTYFVVDGLYTSLSSMNRHHMSVSKHRSNWMHSHLIELLHADEVANPEEVLINLMFERKDIDDYYRDNLNLIYQLPDTLELLTKHTETLIDVIPKLSVKGQMQFIDELPKSQKAFIKQCPKLIVILSASTSKAVREIAVSKISLFDNSVVQPHLIALLADGNTKQRREVADILARAGEENRPILEQALANEKQKSVIQAIESALSRLESLQQVADVEFVTDDFEPIVSQNIPDSFVKVIEANYEELLEKYCESAEREIESNKINSYKSTWAQQKYKSWKKIDIKQKGQVFIDALNGDGKSGILNNSDFITMCTHKQQIQKLPEYGLHHCMRILKKNDYVSWHLFNEIINIEYLSSIELRQLAKVMKECDIKNPNRFIAEEYLEDKWSVELPQYMHTSEQIVPFFMENIDFISEALGLLPNKRNKNNWRIFEVDKALDILIKFPHLPKQFIPKILELALGENKYLRVDAQEILSDVPNIHQRAVEALGNGKQAIRVTAVEWLGRLNKLEEKNDEDHGKEIIKALYTLLKKEKKEIVIASILTTLEGLGEDISKYLSPTALLKDAEKGLSGKILKSFEWFDLESLPKVTWHNGKKVNPKIIQWWVVLAEKLKDPTPNGLLQRYMSLLDDKSQQTLSLFLLQTFIHEDTRNPSLAEATAIAEKDAPRTLLMYQNWYKRYPQYHPEFENITIEQVVERLKNEHLAIYLGSAIKSKGMLALTYRTDGSTAVKLIQDFMKRHYRRNAQVMALLTVFSVSDDPLIIQLLLGLSRRYRTTSVQDLAKSLVVTIADRNNWTADELADRTIPTAGLGDNGVMSIDYGSRTLSAYVNDKDKFVLQNEEGKVIKSLPAPRQSDGDNEKSQIKEAKSLFSTSKKELKQVLELQTARLYEAMCSQRLWTKNDWQEYLFAHPIMKRLITRLIWLEVDGEGNILRSFRPSDDGSLLDYDDEEISLINDTSSFITLAHSMLMSAEECERWTEHLNDYEVKPLFGGSGKMSSTRGMIGTQTQFDNRCPAFKKQADKIDDFKGYVTDTFTLRSVLTKMGYQRSSIEDGGSFDRYYKNYDSLGMSAVIVFSGSYVPEENLSAVVYELCFEENTTSYSWNSNYVALEKVNPILLAESYAEYKKLADATGGFDEEWEKKTPW